jgi:hypothetical protein
MVAKLKAIKLELQRREHHRTTEVGIWLRKVVLGYHQYRVVPGNSTQLCSFSRRVCGLSRNHGAVTDGRVAGGQGSGAAQLAARRGWGTMPIATDFPVIFANETRVQ